MATILVVDDDRGVFKSFSALFRGEHTILGAYNGKEAEKLLQENEVELVFLDYRLPGEDGLAVLKTIRSKTHDADIVMITAYGSLETIVHSIALGACDYLEKPLDIGKIKIITQRVLESRKMRHYVRVIQDEQQRAYNLTRVVGKSQVMQNVFKAIGRLVNNDVIVLITGESGTGKELIARALHFNGNRYNEPFIAVNCSALPDTLLENELFGHEAQAYTGATSRQAGKFEAAAEGTIFLDEIGDLPFAIQTKLLRVLQEREFQRLGGTRNITLKARVIAATNRNLLTLIKDGRFREDLYYRINVASIEVPPLRERREDIPLLVEHFIKVAASKLNKNLHGITDEARTILERYPWPGNVRELENVILSLGINCQSGIIQTIEIPRYLSGNAEEIDLFSVFTDEFLKKYHDHAGLLELLYKGIEPALIRKLLVRLGNNKTAVADRLGISRVTLQHKISQMNQP
ncbi:MAG: sigma-54-dependent Fis family transcriptional regulator [Spirochaetaceae bacterium]|nr:MAG: sigma-54-dependent Fis family transcriptional regulator [Spirochaetaceae bacterium]